MYLHLVSLQPFILCSPAYPLFNLFWLRRARFAALNLVKNNGNNDKILIVSESSLELFIIRRKYNMCVIIVCIHKVDKRITLHYVPMQYYKGFDETLNIYIKNQITRQPKGLGFVYAIFYSFPRLMELQYGL